MMYLRWLFVAILFRDKNYDLKIKVIIITLSVLFFSSGCKKWLDKSPTDNLAVPKTLVDLQALLDNKDDLSEGVTPSMLEASADDYFIEQAEYNGQAGNHDRIAPYTWDLDPYSGTNDWRLNYYPIYASNLCLQQLGTITRTNLNGAEWDNVKGSALFTRAYYFLELSWTYAVAFDPATAKTDLGIVLRLKPNINDKSVRASVQQCYDQIIGDTKEAVSYLPERSIHCLRPSKISAYALLARTYLSMRLYDSSLKYSNLALQGINDLMDFNGDPDIISDFSLPVLPFRRYNKEIIFYTSMNSIHTTPLPSYARIDTILYETYAPDDLRRLAFFSPLGKYKYFKGNYAPGNDYLFTGIATDEVLLMRAECLARVGGQSGSGDKDAALSDLNALLTKRWKIGKYQPINASTAKLALSIILNERRKELVMRGLRWMDLKRLNKEGAGINLQRFINGKTYLLPPNDNRYAQPIPQEIIDETGIPQNPR